MFSHIQYKAWDLELSPLCKAWSFKELFFHEKGNGNSSHKQ